MAELLVCREFDRVDKAPFMNVYKESSSENAVRWYPELSAEAALQKYEEGYADYMAHGFADEGGLSFILQENGVYVCALRLFPRGAGSFTWRRWKRTLHIAKGVTARSCLIK